jgi:hypothetical protein
MEAQVKELEALIEKNKPQTPEAVEQLLTKKPQ